MKVNVLDCTLRDGGYCNQWEFGEKNIQKILTNLNEANIDIVECGFLTERVQYRSDVTKFTSLEHLKRFLPKRRFGKTYVVMINYGEYDVRKLPEYDGTSIDGIRLAFHKGQRMEALIACEIIKKKGYKVFVQPMISLNYTDFEFLELIEISNKIEPYAFYIVDSFGMMRAKDLTRLFYVVEHNLKETIWIGFHSHNNLQLAYSNAQHLLQINVSRNLILDTSVYGMGRGAGNLNTELFVEHLNDHFNGNYDLKPLLRIIDEILNEFHHRNYWGYSLPNYLSATYNSHPNYAAYLDDKKTLTVEMMSEIFEMMDDEKRVEFDRDYIESLYTQYMEAGQSQLERSTHIKQLLHGKKVLLIAPGKSSSVEKEKIADFVQHNDVITISVNFNYCYAPVDYIFISNMRRFRSLGDTGRKCIVTSNIVTDNVYLRINYHDYINDEEVVKDNAGLMAISFLIEAGAEKIFLAGFDGYSHDTAENYGDSHMAYITKNAILDAMNQGMNKLLSKYSQKISIVFFTPKVHLG